MTTTERQLKAITVPEGSSIVRRQYEQTASRDHNVTLVPGTYDVHPVKSPEGRINMYRASIRAVAAARTQSTVEFGGVALAWEDRPEQEENYGWSCYSYEVDTLEAVGTFELHFEVQS